MGKLKDMINGIDQSKDTEREIGEQLKVLTALGETKVEIFKAEIEASLKDGKTMDDLKVPITKVLGSFEEYRAYTTRTQEKLMEDVSESITTMFGGGVNNIVSGVSSLVTKGLNVILGAGSGEEMMKKEYYIVVEYPAIIRYDIAMWTRNVSVRSLQERMNNIIACVAYKSAVDVTKLDFNTFLGCYSAVLREGFGDNKADIKNMIAEAGEVFGMFQQGGKRGKAEERELNLYTDMVCNKMV